MNRTRRLLAATAVGAFLLVGVAACGSSAGSDSSSGDTAKTTAADSSGDTSTDGTAAYSADSGDSGDQQDCDATADSDNLSGDSVVLFSADQSELSEADLTDDVIAVVSADHTSMEPGTLEVKAGTMFGIQNAEGGDLDGVIIGCAGGQTMVPGTAIGFVITEPGTYPVSLDIAGTDIGTVVVS